MLQPRIYNGAMPSSSYYLDSKDRLISDRLSAKSISNQTVGSEYGGLIVYTDSVPEEAVIAVFSETPQINKGVTADLINNNVLGLKPDAVDYVEDELIGADTIEPLPPHHIIRLDTPQQIEYAKALFRDAGKPIYDGKDGDDEEELLHIVENLEAKLNRSLP